VPNPVYAAEELEETAKLLILFSGRYKRLGESEVEELKRVFGG